MTEDYKTGYKKPPRHTRFKPGQSGNPTGRPKYAKNLKTDLEEELQETIFVREGETRKQVTKQRAMLKALTARGVQGDTRAASLVVDMVYRLVHTDAPEASEEPLDDEDIAILDAYERRFSRARSEADTETAGGGPNWSGRDGAEDGE